MKKIVLVALMLISIFGMLGASSVEAQTIPWLWQQIQQALGPPTWSRILPVATRFVLVLNNEAVLDRETGLVWERSPGDFDGNGVVDSNDRIQWHDAQIFCNNKVVGGRKGWRMPTIQELASLVDPSVPSPGPTLPVGHPFVDVQSSDYYWSATTYGSNTVHRWVVLFDNGDLTFSPSEVQLNFCWCVRGGQGVDPQ